MSKRTLDDEYRLKLVQSMAVLGQMFKETPPTSETEKALEYLCYNVLSSLDPIFQEYLNRCKEFVNESPGICVVNSDGTLNPVIFDEDDNPSGHREQMETAPQQGTSKKQSLWETAIAAAMGISLSGLFNRTEEPEQMDPKLEAQQVSEFHDMLASLDIEGGNF